MRHLHPGVRLINSWVERGRIKASYRRKNGELEIRDLGEAEYAGFIRAGETLQDRNIIEWRPDFPGWQKLIWRDWETRNAACDQNPSLIFEGDVSPPRRFITDRNCIIEPPRRAYLDIETDSRVPFSRAIEGDTRLLSWALVDQEGNKYSDILQDDHDQAEAELWALLWTFMGQYDQISAWNGDRFDFEVMKQRCMRLGKQHRVLEPYWEHRQRLLFVDQMLCFKRHHMAAESGDEKTSLRLDDVCEALIGEGKKDFDASKTWEAWEEIPDELLEYNMQDTVLLPKLEAKTGYLDLQQTIGEATLTPVNTHTLKPMPWIDAYLLKMAHRRKTHLVSKLHGDGLHEEVEGAIVMAPTKLGIHRNVHVCDYKSLYPTIMRSWNLGPETKLGKEPDGASSLQCMSPSGVYFRTDEKSMMAEFEEDMMGLRDKWKKEKKKHAPGTAAWRDADRFSKAYKIACNSGFGVSGNPYFRLYDPQITEAIIQGARLMLTTASEEAKKQGKETIYGDTDSLFIVGGTKEEFKAFVDHCNKAVFPPLLESLGCRKEHCCVELDYEKQFSMVVFPQGTKGVPSAKRYFGRYVHSGGQESKYPGPGEAFDPNVHSLPEIRGLEYMRTDVTKATRRLQREAIEMILTGSSSEDMEEWVKSKRGLFFDNSVALEDIVLSKGISRDLTLYKVDSPHVRLAKAMADAGEDVGEGTRISYVVEDARVSPSKVIPADDFDGTNLDKVFYWSRQLYPATMRVLAGAYPDRPWHRWIVKYPKVKVLPGQLSLLS